jgi:hypothetical protein
MEAATELIHRYSYDVIDTDDIYSYSKQTAAVGEMLKMIDYTNDIYLDLRVKLESHVPPNTYPEDKVYKYWRKGACFKGEESLCDDPALYDATVGYTKELAKSGLDHQFFKFLETASKFISEKDYLGDKSKASSFILLELLSESFYQNFERLIRAFNEYSAESTVSATVALFSLAACVFISFFVYYRIGFAQASDSFSSTNRQLVSLVFMVSQADRVKNQDLNTFVESSGASIN